MTEIDTNEYHKVLIEELTFIDKVCKEQNLTYFLMFGTLIGAIRHKGFIPWDDDVDVMMPRKDYEAFCEYVSKIENCKYSLVTNENRQAPYLITRLSDDRYQLEFEYSKKYEIGIFIDIYPMDGAGKTKIGAIINGFYVYLQMRLFCLTVDDEGYSNLKFPKKMLKNILKKLQKLPLFEAKNKLEKFCKKHPLEKSNYCACMIWLGGNNEILNKKYFEKISTVKFEGGNYCAPTEYDLILKGIYGEYMKFPPESERIGHHYYRILKKV